MRKIFLAILLVLCGAVAHADPQSDAYRVETLDGFMVFVSPEVSADARLDKAARDVLHTKLLAIQALVSPAQMAFFRTIPFWIEKDRTNGGATFNPSRDWLIEHGQNPDKAGGIEIMNATNFCNWATSDQPMMVLHELAHAYHFRVLGENYAPIEAAYRNALDRHLYESVNYIHGGQKRAYALNDRKEFFAELTEAYFGRNDFFPYDKADLRSYDPVGFKLMETVWGKTPG